MGNRITIRKSHGTVEFLTKEETKYLKDLFVKYADLTSAVGGGMYKKFFGAMYSCEENSEVQQSECTKVDTLTSLLQQRHPYFSFIVDHVEVVDVQKDKIRLFYRTSITLPEGVVYRKEEGMVSLVNMSPYVRSDCFDAIECCSVNEGITTIDILHNKIEEFLEIVHLQYKEFNTYVQSAIQQLQDRITAIDMEKSTVNKLVETINEIVRE